MSSQAKGVQVQLLTEIRDEERKETMKVNEPGRFFSRGKTKVLLFTEHPDEGEPIQTMITMKPAHVSIKRSGGVDMHQVFQPERETENIYHHTYGDFYMKTYTEQLEFHSMEDLPEGKLFIQYKMTINQEVTQAHRLTLTFKEEGK